MESQEIVDLKDQTRKTTAVKQVKFKVLHTTTWLTILSFIQDKGEMNIHKDPEFYNDDPDVPVFEQTATNKNCLYTVEDIVRILLHQSSNICHWRVLASISECVICY